MKTAFFMRENIPIFHWKRYFIDRGLPSLIVDDYLAYIEKLNANNVPVIFEFEHLSKLLGLNLDALAAMVSSPVSFYRTFVIPKRRGGQREIDAPYPSLLNAQKWIYKNILIQQEVSEYAYGFVCDKSIVDNAKLHVGQKAFLKMDLKDFFPSISKRYVIQIFKEMGYALNVAYYLASLCCLNDKLTQGAATSPCLSNIVCRHLDNRLSGLAKKYKLIYSRYADDLAFSGNYIPTSFIQLVSEAINDCGFVVNHEKTYLSHGKGKRILTGISISGEEVRVPREFKREVKKEAYYVVKYGLLSHISKKKIRDQFYLESLHGRLTFWVNVEPNNKTATYFRNAIRKILNAMNE